MTGDQFGDEVDGVIPQTCQTEGCRRDTTRQVDYYARNFSNEHSGPTFRCGPCASAFQQGSTAGRSDTTITVIET